MHITEPLHHGGSHSAAAPKPSKRSAHMAFEDDSRASDTPLDFAVSVILLITLFPTSVCHRHLIPSHTSTRDSRSREDNQIWLL